MPDHPRAVSRYYPRSFLKLLLLGFTLVLLPPLAAFYGASSFVDRLATQGERAVSDAAQIARGSRTLVDQTTAMERSSRQYVILRDPALRESYQRSRDAFRGTLSDLSRLPLDPPQQAQLSEIATHAARIDELMSSGRPRPEQAKRMVAEFVALSDLSDAVLAQSSAVIDREIRHMQHTTEDAQKILFRQVLATLPLGILIALAFTFLIARPIRQIDSAIRQLGSADFSREISVDGPEDLGYLGRQLDWLRRRLVALEEQKERFLRGVSHELKTPLTALHEGIALLGEDVGGMLTVRQREIVAIMRANSARLQHQIEDLLDFQRAQFGGENLQIETVDGAALAQLAIDDQRIPALARGVSIVPRLEPVSLRCDPERLKLILENLLVNAVKFSPRGGVVMLQLECHDDEAWFEVADQGPGIPAGDRERVFEWFYQGRSAPGAAVKGTGLGLAIAQEIANAHGGRIALVDHPGPGARFRLQLPLAQDAHA